MSKWLFGITNIRWGIKELIKLGSSQPSYFSKKRIESGLAFWLLLSGHSYWLIVHITTMTAVDLTIWGSTLAIVCGYYTKQIENAKNPIERIQQEITIKQSE